MRIEKDALNDLMYIYFKEEIGKGDAVTTREILPSVYADFDTSGYLLGIEIVNTQTVLGRKVEDL